MSQHGQTTAKEYCYDLYKHRTNQICLSYNHLILENSMKITKIKIMEWKTDEGWSYKWCNFYTTLGYQIITDVLQCY